MDNLGPVLDNPRLLGLHPNSEILVRTEQTNEFCLQVMELQPKDDVAKGGGQSQQQRVGGIIEDLMEKVADCTFDLEDIKSQVTEDERGPYQNVFLQEIQRMNFLVKTMIDSCTELQKGLAGELTMSQRMEELMNSLFIDIVPPTWAKFSYPSMRGLASWVENLTERCSQLGAWSDQPTTIPRVVDVSYFFNPQSFLTAIMQTTAQENSLELDKLQIMTEVTRNQPKDIVVNSREGAYVTGLYLVGCRWDKSAASLEESNPREMFMPMPVINCKAILGETMPKSGVYNCPTYQTQQRGPTYVFTATLKTKHAASKWTLAGVAMVMEVE
jgi:dynein heavy chain